MATALRRAAAIVGGAAAGLWLIGERGRLMLPSTRALLREMGWHSLLSERFWHTYAYARWTKQYLGWAIKHVFPRMHPVAGERRWADQYHGKILPTELAKALLTVNEPIARQDLEHIIPYATAREIVLSGPPDIAAYECACRAARPNPCQPTQVCMIVGQPFVDFVLEHHPTTSRRLTQAEAVALLDAERARGHIHAAFFRDVMLNRFYAICNCCACCCGALEAMQRGVPMVSGSGFVAQVAAERCLGCGTCEDCCPFGAIAMDGVCQIDWERCMGCGVCEAQCPEEAISLVADARKGIPLDVRALV